MATITATSMVGGGAREVTETTLDGSSDTFSYAAGHRMVLILRNPTGAPISPTIDGDGASTVNVDRVGPLDISGGYAVGAVGAGEVHAIPLDTIAAYLAGTIAITSGSGLVASLLNY